MQNSYRIRTKPGVDSSIKILLDQEYEFLEILSLKILQSQIYTRQCSDYGVIVGRVSVNNGFGIPNAKVSIFIPLSGQDELNPVISELYPYKTLSDLNEDGYRYNLLPYEKQHSGHNPTGTFFSREDVLTNPTSIEVYNKYYRYTSVTNDSGDFMIFGVPIGTQTIVMDVDLSDIGEFSLSPQDLIRMNLATESQVAGVNFKTSSNLNELPQIITINKTIEVQPLWGQPEICEIGINRIDFDLSNEAQININPTAIFMGSLISSGDDDFVKRNCKTKPKAGSLCKLVTGPGEILAIRQTSFIDENGRPILESVTLDEGGQVIDENGAWLIDLPMNLEYVYTNEFGERVISNDPNIGIPTKAKYRFKVKWNQSPSLSAEPIKRGYFLVPNIREYGWDENRKDPLQDGTVSSDNIEASQKSYAFSLDWNDYGNTGTTMGLQMIQDAIDCEDRFYEFQYNKVYTVSQLITQYRNGYGNWKIIAIKDILDDKCESENYKFPTNDSVFRFDIIYLLFSILLFISRPILYVLLVVVHILAFALLLIGPLLALVYTVLFPFILLLCNAWNLLVPLINAIIVNDVDTLDCPNLDDYKSTITTLLNLYKYFTQLRIPNLSYPDCEFCNCADGVPTTTDLEGLGLTDLYNAVDESGLNAILTPFEIYSNYNITGLFATETKAYELSFGGLPLTSPPVPMTRTPQPQKIDDFTYGFTLNLTPSEKLNLFNTKAKYFDNSPINPGGGVNQIEVSFNASDPDTHTDNSFVIVVQPGFESTFQAGNLISFQNPNLSKDPNQTGSTVNEFGNNSSTGMTINDGGIITVNYVKPDGSNSTVTYTSTQIDDDVTYSKFPMDIEYFQVITATTLSNYTGLCDTYVLGINDTTLPYRFILNKMQFYNTIIFKSVPFNDVVVFTGPSPLLTPSNWYSGLENHMIVFMVRGVDPYTTRSKCKYDLSKLFGYTSFGSITVQSDINGAPEYHLNQPIIGGFKNIQHNLINSDDTDGYSSMELYYDSFHYEPGTNWSSFTSDLQSYYSQFDSNNGDFKPDVSLPKTIGDGNSGFVISTEGLKISNLNNYYKEFGYTSGGVYIFTESNTGFGYLKNEIVEGGSGFHNFDTIYTEYDLDGDEENRYLDYYQSYYYAPKYVLANMNYDLGSSGKQIIMRSDRLPTSTTLQNNLNNSFPLHTNVIFSIYQINDDGTVLNVNGIGGSQGVNLSGTTLDNSGADEPASVSSVFETFNCGGMVPLSCYTVGDTPNEVAVLPEGNACYEDPVGGKLIFSGGCYIFVSTIFLSLIKDFSLLTEWTSRLSITFAACRNVWGHLFTNNWVNGTLYAFSLRNDVVYTSPFSDNPNQPTFNYCKDVSLIHSSTNNYYYRSSPWDYNNLRFVGQNSPSGLFGSFGGNQYNLMYPTTVMDLGPRNFYMNELVLTDGYDGYVVNKMNSTTYSDVSDVLNLLIVSRFANLTFLNSMISGANVLKYFSRSNNMVDGDYAQSISVTSELGVTTFESENYPDLPGQNPIYFNGFFSTEQVFGVFYNADLQVRDYISPKRTIINPAALATELCAFNNFPVKSQVVPFYQWEVKTNSYMDNIFGSEQNDWYTIPISDDSFFSYRYQSLDRVELSSRYFRTNGSLQTQHLPGFIYSVSAQTYTIDATILGDVLTITAIAPTPSYIQQGFIVTDGTFSATIVSQTSGISGETGDYTITNITNGPAPATIVGGTINGFVLSAEVSTWNQNTEQGRVINVGAPFHFYFGLKRGKSAFDRFYKKWINSEQIIE